MDLILPYGIQTYVRRIMSFSRAQRTHGGAVTIRKIKKQDEKYMFIGFYFWLLFQGSLLFAGTFASSSEKSARKIAGIG